MTTRETSEVSISLENFTSITSNAKMLEKKDVE